MNDESLKALQRCLELCDRLKQLVTADSEQLGAYLTGPVLTAYRENADLALDRIGELKAMVLALFSREQLGI